MVSLYAFSLSLPEAAELRLVKRGSSVESFRLCIFLVRVYGLWAF